MPKSESVNLNVQPGQNTGTGWTTVTAPNTNQQYSFKYTGGENDNGGLKTKVGDGQATLALNLQGSNNRYSVNDVTFSGDTYSQLTRTFSGTTATITDQNTQVETADYCVMVLDSNNGSIIPCDPMISNDPRGPMMQHRIQHM